MAGFSNAAFSPSAFDPNAFDLGTPAVVNESFSDAAFGKDTAFDSGAFSFGSGVTSNISFWAQAFAKDIAFDSDAWSFDDSTSIPPEVAPVEPPAPTGGGGGGYGYTITGPWEQPEIIRRKREFPEERPRTEEQDILAFVLAATIVIMDEIE